LIQENKIDKAERNNSTWHSERVASSSIIPDKWHQDHHSFHQIAAFE
jgi:hypothetical protein